MRDGATWVDRILRPPSEKVKLALTARTEPCCTGSDIDPERRTFSPAVLWEGVWSGWSGYAKACRELGHRAAQALYVRAVHAIEIPWHHEAEELRTSALTRVRIPKNAPYLRFFGPDKVLPSQGVRVLYTMMETEFVHPDMIAQANAKFDELWVPTAWGEAAFKRSGLALPIRVMPLGVNAAVYRPTDRAAMPECVLLSTDKAGTRGVPAGFIFLSLSIPSFRKGFDLLSQAFEDAFPDDNDVDLVIAVTHAATNLPMFSELPKLKRRIWGLTGEFDEHALARVYNAAHAYVSASRGEGWNLPVCEAAACGLPVIAPENTTHPEVCGRDAFLFRHEGVGLFPGSESISPWYEGVPFSIFGKKSHAELVDLLRLVRSGDPEVRRRAAALRQKMLVEWTWDSAAAKVAHRLLELQP